MPTKTKAQPVFYRTSYTEKLTFSTKPDAATRRALREAGFIWNGTQWFRNHNPQAPIQPAELAHILAPVVEQAEDEPEAN